MDLGALTREQAVQQVSRATVHPSLGRQIATDADRAGRTCPGQRRTRPTRCRRWCAVSTTPAGVPTPAGRPVPAWLLRSQQGSRPPELAEPAESVPRPLLVTAGAAGALGRAQPERHAAAAAGHLASTARSTTDGTPPSAAQVDHRIQHQPLIGPRGELSFRPNASATELFPAPGSPDITINMGDTLACTPDRPADQKRHNGASIRCPVIQSRRIYRI